MLPAHLLPRVSRLVARKASQSLVKPAGVSSLSCFGTSGRRSFSVAHSKQEPSFLVEPDDQPMDPKQILVPYIVDGKRVEIYQKHKEDPVKWSARNISQHYSMSIYRARAILYLMKKREDMMKESGVLNAPDAWHHLYENYRRDPEIPIESLAEEFGLQEDEASKILKTMKEHHHRKENMQDYNDYMDWSLDLLQLLGVNTSFTEYGYAKVPGDNAYEDSYFPQMFGDNSLEAERERIRARLMAASKAEAAAEKPILFNKYESRVGYWKKQNITDNGEMKGDSELTRWKFGFKELRKPEKGEDKPPTLIRTRRGRLRPANPLEDMNRSWNRKPRGIDHLTRGAERLSQYLDPDQDEKEALAISHDRRIRKEKLLREHDLLKY